MKKTAGNAPSPRKSETQNNTLRKLQQLQGLEPLQRIKERTSRTSLTIALGLFVFLILLAAIGLTVLGLYILVWTGVLTDMEGELQFGLIVLFMSLISLVLGGVIAFLTSRLPLKPINNLINKLNRLAAGDFRARLQFGSVLSSHAAFKEISTSFNKMAEELESTELLRSDFINNFSHEFKTPIVSIAGFAKLLARTDLTDEQRASYLKSIEEESMRLSSMATNVLTLSKLEKQSILTDIATFNLSEQIRSVLLLLEAKWDKKELELCIELDEYMIDANEELLKEVWINLIDNAVKFTPVGGSITISIEKAEGALLITVDNTGESIPPEKQEKVFTKFYQADESRTTEGNGIGLAIVARIVQLHSGSVSLSSGDGHTAFTVKLPQSRRND